MRAKQGRTPLLPSTQPLPEPRLGENSKLTVEPSEIGFGAVQVGTTAERTVIITNTGGTAITIGAVKFTDPVTGEEIVGGPFSLAEPLPVGGLTIQPGESSSVDLDVEFSPTADTGDSEDSIRALLSFYEGLLDGSIGDAIGVVNEAGDTVTGIDLSGEGTTENPNSQLGAQGDCTITGTDQSEPLTGTALPDVICGLDGNDTINGLANDDILRGGLGKDRITDKSGKDKLIGQGGKDRLNAKDGEKGDRLQGGGGKDRAIKDKKDRAKGI